MKTSTIPVSAPQWFIIDADGQSLGHLATKAAHLLRGKHKPTFAPHQIGGDQVVVINASKLNFGWRRLQQKEYIKHSGYLGHTKAISIKDLLATHPERVVELAVKGMLPKNRLRNELLKRLHVFGGAEHTHTAQQPQLLPLE